jgi:hypothetical protein
LCVALLVFINNVDIRYFYETIRSASIPGSPSYLLDVTDEQLMSIYQSCGFFKVKRNCFSNAIFQAFIEGLNVWMDITRYASPTCSLLARILGQGSYPSEPLHQVKDKQATVSKPMICEERQLVEAMSCAKLLDTKPRQNELKIVQ